MFTVNFITILVRFIGWSECELCIIAIIPVRKIEFLWSSTTNILASLLLSIKTLSLQKIDKNLHKNSSSLFYPPSKSSL